MALFADMNQLRRQSVRHVHHGRRLYSSLGKLLDDVLSGLGLQLTLNKILFTREIRNEILASGRRHLFALEQLQTHVCRPKVARHADYICRFGAVAVNDFITDGLAKTCY